ncbi:MAG: Peptidase M16 domain protein [Parcubacteria group bacterium GW2011_GWA2_47_7]|nr:MAG: Peptidase M16 domain protein [Parcubacteria group bacterium GW2011_GWA2_47_7]
MKKPTIKKLANGMKMLLVPMSDQRTATVLVLVETGSKYETKDKNGISHFLEHMCFKGTSNRPSQLIISRELDSMGAEYNAFTGHEYTGYYVKVAADHLPVALDLISDIYCNSLLKEEDIEQERGAIVGEINMYEDMPMRKVGDLFMYLVYGEQPAGWEIAGPKELVTTFSRTDFISYRTMHYVPVATTVIVAGKFAPKNVESMIKKQFASLEKGKKYSKLPVNDAQSKPAVLVKYKESDQTHLILGVRSFPLMHKYYPVLGVMAAVLGGGMSSRLFQKVRTEMGLGYYVRAANDSFTDHGMFAASAGVVNERALEAVSAILAELRQLKTELVPPVELRKAKDMMAGRLMLGLESSDEIAEFFGFQEILRKKLTTPEELVARMRKVTAKDIQDVARQIFVTEHLNLALIGPWRENKDFIKLLKF